jgi:glycerophosphoryl diester phosphodiesterase
MHSYLTGAGRYILAHRGGAGSTISENSLQAFKNATELGCKYLETDVRLGRDRKLYLAHGAASTPQLTLEELFDSFPDSFFAIDPKHVLAIEPLAELIVQKRLENSVCIGASFDGRAKRVADLVELKGGVRPATALVSAAASIRLLLNTVHIPIKEHASGATFIHVHKQLVNRGMVAAAHQQNLKLIAWVVNDKPTMQRLLNCGVDGFMTDYPGAAKELFEKF